MPLLLLAVALATPPSAPKTMNEIADAYVRLVLALGVHDADYVDAYYGPPEWRTEAEARKAPLAGIQEEARALIATLGAVLRLPYRPGRIYEQALRVAMSNREGVRW